MHLPVIPIFLVGMTATLFRGTLMSTVVITGGSRGIGAAAVKLFAELGHRVYFLYEKEHAAAKSVSDATG